MSKPDLPREYLICKFVWCPVNKTCPQQADCVHNLDRCYQRSLWNLPSRLSRPLYWVVSIKQLLQTLPAASGSILMMEAYSLRSPHSPSKRADILWARTYLSQNVYNSQAAFALTVSWLFFYIDKFLDIKYRVCWVPFHFDHWGRECAVTLLSILHEMKPSCCGCCGSLSAEFSVCFWLYFSTLHD